MKKLFLFVATCVLAMSFSVNANAADGDKTNDGKKGHPSIEYIVRNLGGHTGGPRRAELAQSNQIGCENLGEADIVILDL